MGTGSAPRAQRQLAEWTSCTLDYSDLTENDLTLLRQLSAGHDARLTVDELRTGVRVAARSWVGLLRLERLDLTVVPKLAGGNLGLIDMVAFTTGLDALKNSRGRRTLNAEGLSLFDLMAFLLVEQCEEVLRDGLLSDYVEREESLPVIRGRLLADQQVLRRFARVDQVICRHDSHEQDIAENQLLAAALSRCATRVRHDLTRQRVRRQLAILLEACDPAALELGVVRREMAYHRLNAHYQDAHALAWLVLDGLGTKDLLAPGSVDCFAFLIDMNRLFERFVHKLVERLLKDDRVRVHYQWSDASVIVNAATGDPYSRVIPDVLVESSNGARVAIDAKYKLYDDKKLSSSDVYQSFLYAYAYGGGAGALPTAMILYPAATEAGCVTRLKVRGGGARTSAEITALGISIPQVLLEVNGGRGGVGTRGLVEAVRNALGFADQRFDGAAAFRFPLTPRQT